MTCGSHSAVKLSCSSLCAYSYQPGHSSRLIRTLEVSMRNHVKGDALYWYVIWMDNHV